MSSEHDPPADDEDKTTHETAADPDTQRANTGDYERAPRDFESDIDAQAVRVPDHPVIVRPKIEGEIKEASAYLVTEGEINEYVNEAPDEAEADDFGTKAIVELINEKYVSPDFSLTVEDVENSPAGYYSDLFTQIVPELGN